MRKALNENTTVQIALVGVMLALIGLLFMTRMSSGGGEAEQPSAVPAEAGATGATGAAPVAGDSAAAAPAGSAATAAPPTSAGPAGDPTAAASPAGTAPSPPPVDGSVPAEALVPGPGLPPDVMRSWRRGEAIVVLIVRNKGIDDRLVRDSVDALEARGGLAVFVAKAKNVARYSRITQGVGVSQVPALVVVRPRPVSGGVPQAAVSYGFRNHQSVVQAVEDALYEGRDDLPYHPG